MSCNVHQVTTGSLLNDQRADQDADVARGHAGFEVLKSPLDGLSERQLLRDHRKLAARRLLYLRRGHVDRRPNREPRGGCVREYACDLRQLADEGLAPLLPLPVDPGKTGAHSQRACDCREPGRKEGRGDLEHQEESRQAQQQEVEGHDGNAGRGEAQIERGPRRRPDEAPIETVPKTPRPTLGDIQGAALGHRGLLRPTAQDDTKTDDPHRQRCRQQ